LAKNSTKQLFLAKKRAYMSWFGVKTIFTTQIYKKKLFVGANN